MFTKLFRASRRRTIASLLILVVSLHAMSCGTILHPERRGQPPGRLDPAIVLLDGLGLLLFFIPGVIAFAIDFSNGTIYLPPGGYSSYKPETTRGQSIDFVEVHVDPDELTPERLEEIIAEHTGKSVSIESSELQTRQLSRIDEFERAAAELAAGHSEF